MAFADNEGRFGHGSATLITGQSGLIVHSSSTTNSVEDSQRAQEVYGGSPPTSTRPTQPMSKRPTKTSPPRLGVHHRAGTRSVSDPENRDKSSERDALRQQSARDRAYVTHLATVVASREKQMAEHTMKLRDFEIKAQKLENDLDDKIAEANRNAKGFVVELAARVDRVEGVVQILHKAKPGEEQTLMGLFGRLV